MEARAGLCTDTHAALAEYFVLNYFLCVLSKVDTDCSMKSLTSAKIQTLIGLLCLLVYNGKKFTIPNPYFELEKRHTVMKLLLFILSGLKQHEH